MAAAPHGARNATTSICQFSGARPAPAQRVSLRRRRLSPLLPSTSRSGCAGLEPPSNLDSLRPLPAIRIHELRANLPRPHVLPPGAAGADFATAPCARPAVAVARLREALGAIAATRAAQELWTGSVSVNPHTSLRKNSEESWWKILDFSAIRDPPLRCDDPAAWWESPRWLVEPRVAKRN